MGDQGDRAQAAEQARGKFMRHLLRDVRAMEQMLEQGTFEQGIRRIGAEQELFIVDSACRPAPLAREILAAMDEPLWGHELGLFNLECSVDPVVFGGDCLSRMERQLTDLIALARAAANDCDAEIILTGILPTLERADLGLHNQTPNPRYRLLNDTLSQLRGGAAYEISIKGPDELQLKHDTVMLEAANTSFQIHFQVAPDEFCRLYNIAQAVTAPVLAAATNSPLLFGKRLWRETRIALFQQSVDTRNKGRHMRELAPRVSYGTEWVRDSVLDIYREDIARFRVLFPADEEDALAVLAAGDIPRLRALCLHNSTVYRWNRPCYGILDGKPHLRIENRVLPSGPTPIDEMANAAFWFGLMSGVLEEFGDVTKHMDFSDARGNFISAARNGLSAPITWFGDRTLPAHDLIEQHLLPLAREGLRESNIDEDDIERYLDVIAKRVSTRQTGSSWMLRSYNALRTRSSASEALSSLTAVSIRRQREGHPVHEWALAAPQERTDWKSNHLRVGQFMGRDLFTINQDEPVELAASLMTWHHIHWVPVEDHDHNLVGMVTHDMLLKIFADPSRHDVDGLYVSDIMAREVPSISPDTLTIDALRMMQAQQLVCLPVVSDQQLVGIVSEQHLLAIARQLLEEHLGQEDARETL